MFYPVFEIEDDPDYFIMSIIEYEKSDLFNGWGDEPTIGLLNHNIKIIDYFDKLINYYEDYSLDETITSYQALEEAQKQLIRWSMP